MAEERLDATRAARAGDGDGAAARLVDQIRTWRDALVNLNRRSRLLYYRATAASSLELAARVEELFDLLPEGKGVAEIWEPPEPSKSGPEPKEDQIITAAREPASLRKVLRNLERRSSQEYLEKGLWILYLAVGFLDWLEAPDQPVSSPVLFVPVRLSRDGPKSLFTLSRDENEPSVNPALTIKLQSDFGIALPSVEDFNEEEPETFFAAVEAAVVGQEGWGIRRETVLSVFSFHKEAMYRDLLDNESSISDHPLVKAMVLGGDSGIDLGVSEIPEDQIDALAPPEEVATILDADSSQRQALALAAKGHSFVMDGPPGTGKSQTIANVISELLHQGKRVLFVSEKIAALEVVRKRLKAAGLGDFTLELHSHKATRREVARSLGRALHVRARAGADLPAADVATLQRTRRELSDYCLALNERRPDLDRSLHSVLGEITRLQRHPQAPHPTGWSKLTPDSLSWIKQAASRLGRVWERAVLAEDFAWRDAAIGPLDERTRLEVRAGLSAAVIRLTNLLDASYVLAQRLGLSEPHTVARALVVGELAAVLAKRPAGVDPIWLSAPLESVARAATELEGATTEVRTREESLLNVASCEPNEINPADAAVVGTLLSALSAETLKDPALESATALEIRVLEEKLSSAVAALKAGQGLTTAIASILGLSSRPMKFGEAAALADLGARLTPRCVPDPAWLEPQTLERAKTAVEVLERAADAANATRGAVESIFLPSLLGVELEPLRLRFERLHKGVLKWFRSSYWRDRSTLAAHTVEQRFSSETVSGLGRAVEWQKAHRDFSRKEALHAANLGSLYEGVSTDFGPLNEGLRNAEAILGARPEQVSPDALVGALRSGRAVEVSTLSSRAETSLSVAAQALTTSLDGRCAEMVRGLSIDEGAARLDAITSALNQVAKSLHRLDAVRQGTIPTTVSQMLDWSKGRSVLDSARFRLRETEATNGHLLGSAYRGLDTPWAPIKAGIAWARDVKALSGEPLPADRIMEWFQPSESFTRAIEDAQFYRAATDSVGALFLEKGRRREVDVLEEEFEKAEKRLRLLAERLDEIDDWHTYSESRRLLEEKGFQPTLVFCQSERVGGSAIPDIVVRALLESWADGVLSSDPRLRTVRREDRDDAVATFRTLDQKMIRAAAARVIASCNSRMPASRMGAAGLIAREAEKEKRHMPVRRLIEEAGDVALSLKPCFMMSPLSVSQFLPSKSLFDAVIFDEASQVRPEDALNCIYRGRQLILAGDQKQLPPTSFFELADEVSDEWEEDQLEDFTSVLDLAKACGQIPSSPLRWHYRSQHEDLITYSNRAFYEGRLLTFPSAHAQSSDLGVELIRVNGTYRRGGARDNPIEAQAVVERVIHHVRMNPGRTIGVVAFSDAQASAIEAALELRSREVPELRGIISDDRLDGFFVKNLESVQGDDRDIIIFSIGYGPDENGRLSLNFGPINRKGGERRLNVAITRARRRIEIISSITADDLGVDVKSEGLRHLRKYLDFAGRPEERAKAFAIEVSPDGRDAESPFEEEVARVIRSWAFEVVPQVGCGDYRIDMGVVDPARPGRFLLGVECDGAAYHSSKAARDRDRLRQEMLKKLGWGRLHRIWGPAWYRRRAHEEQVLRAAIDSALSESAAPPEPTPPSPGDSSSPGNRVVHEEVVLDEATEWAVSYQLARIQARRMSRAFDDEASRPELKRLLLEVLEVEAPVAFEVLLSRVREAWGLSRAGSRVRAAFNAALKEVLRAGEFQKVGDFISVRRTEPVKVRKPATNRPETFRSVTEVPPAELAAAMSLLVADAQRIKVDELTVRTSRLFGWSRRGSDIGDALENILRELVESNRVALDGDYVLSPSSGT